MSIYIFFFTNILDLANIDKIGSFQANIVNVEFGIWKQYKFSALQVSFKIVLSK